MVSDISHMEKVITTYDDPVHAERLLNKPADAFMPAIHALFPAHARTVLDIGAGPGRDAAWLAARGYQVTAVEPAAALRLRGKQHTAGQDVRWHDDRLPELPVIRQAGDTYDVILLMAVWMFLPVAVRSRTLTRLRPLLRPAGRIFIIAQEGSKDRADLKLAVSQDEFTELAAAASLQIVSYVRAKDSVIADGPLWHNVVLTAAPE